MRRSRSRVVGYEWTSPDPLPRHEDAERLLRQAEARGVVSQWDSDPGWRVVWMTGWPGADLRAARDQLAAWWGRPTGRVA